MAPYVADGDLVVAYRLDPYSVGDAVVCGDPSTGERRVLRIAAAGPCEVDLTDAGELLVDGALVDDATASGGIAFVNEAVGGDGGAATVMPASGGSPDPRIAPAGAAIVAASAAAAARRKARLGTEIRIFRW